MEHEKEVEEPEEVEELVVKPDLATLIQFRNIKFNWKNDRLRGEPEGGTLQRS